MMPSYILSSLIKKEVGLGKNCVMKPSFKNAILTTKNTCFFKEAGISAFVGANLRG